MTVGSVRGQGGRGLFLETGAGWGPGTLSAWGGGGGRGLATSLPTARLFISSLIKNNQQKLRR